MPLSGGFFSGILPMWNVVSAMRRSADQGLPPVDDLRMASFISPAVEKAMAVCWSTLSSSTPLDPGTLCWDNAGRSPEIQGKLMIRDMTLRQKLRKILVPPPVLWMLVYKPQNSSSVYLYPKPVREFVELCEAQHFSRFNELENHLVVDPTESIYPNHETDRALGHRSSCDSPGWSQNLSQLYWLQLAISPAKAIGSYHFLGM